MDPMFLINRENITLPPGKKIVKAHEAATLVAAENLLSQAQQEAGKIIAHARATYEAQEQKGYEDGLEKGKSELVEKIMDTTLATVDYLNSIEKTVADLVIKGIEKIIGQMDEEELVYKMVKSGIAVARNERKVVVKVSSQDLGIVQSRLDDMLSNYAGIGVLDVVEDRRMKKGDCIIESELGIVDASLTTQLAAIKRAVEKRF